VKFVRFLVRFVVVLVLLALLALAYLHTLGFPEFAKGFLLSELRKVGIEARFGSIRLDAFRGVVATGAVFADANAPGQTLAQIDELELHFSFWRLLHKQNAIQAIHIASAELAVPTPPDEAGPAQFTASDAYATFRFADDGTIQVDRLTGVYCGIRLNVSGHLKPRAATGAATGSPKPSESRGQFLFVTKAVRELNLIQVTLPPQLDLDFDLDLAQPLTGKMVARLRGNQFRYRGVQIDSASVDVGMHDGAVEIGQCVASLYGGEVSVKGRYDIAAGQFDVSLTSTTDPAVIAALVAPDTEPVLRELRLQGNPTITARYRLGPETGSVPQLEGAVRTGGLVFRGVEFRSIKFAYDNRGPVIKLSDVEVVTPEGQLTGHGQYHIESSDFEYELDSTLDPTKLVPLMTPVIRQIVEPAWFETPPHIIAQVTGDFVDPDAFAYDAQLDAKRCSYRGVGLEGATGRLQLRHSKLDVQAMRLKRREGDMAGTLLADFNAQRVAFDLSIAANPTEAAGLLGEKAASVMAPYRFGAHTDAQASGQIDFADTARTAWSARVVSDTFSYWKLTSNRTQANLVFTNNTMEINDFDGDLYGGKLQGRTTFAFSKVQPSYSFDFSTKRIDLQTLLTAIEGHESKVSGSLTGHAQITGSGTDLTALEGKGELQVADGILWQAPVFGIFSHVLGNTKATDARATFTITNQFVRSEDMQIAAGAFTAKSRGQLGFDGKMDFRVEAQFLRAWPGIGWISPIIGKLLEYKVGGTLGSPSYRPVNLPKELLPNN
jgi:hypothetical protein